MSQENMGLRAEALLLEHEGLFAPESLEGPVLDLACGDGHNGIFLAAKGLSAVLADASDRALQRAGELAEGAGVKVTLWQVDLEKGDTDPLGKDVFGAILVFRYLHRPLIPSIKRALKGGGILVYETYTIDQPGFGKPHNPDFLLNPGELRSWFKDWDILFSFEGIRENPERAVAQMVCRKPATL